MKDFISREKKEDSSTRQAGVVLQPGAAAVTEAMQAPAKLLRPATSNAKQRTFAQTSAKEVHVDTFLPRGCE